VDGVNACLKQVLLSTCRPQLNLPSTQLAATVLANHRIVRLPNCIYRFRKSVKEASDEHARQGSAERSSL
jgi:hypothetical protein